MNKANSKRVDELRVDVRGRGLSNSASGAALPEPEAKVTTARDATKKRAGDEKGKENDEKAPWTSGLSHCNVSTDFNMLVNEVTGFRRGFQKEKYLESFAKLVLPLQEMQRFVVANKPPSDVVVATISGAVQTIFEELRVKKSGRQRQAEFGKCILNCQKSLSTFIHSLQSAIRKYEENEEDRKVSHVDYFKGVADREKEVMKSAFATLIGLESKQAKLRVQSWLLNQIIAQQLEEESQSNLKRLHQNRNSSLLHADTPEEIRAKIDAMADVRKTERASCSFGYLRRTFSRALARQPFATITGIILMMFSWGYVANTTAAKYSGYSYDGWFVRVYVPLMFVLSGLALFLWGWAMGHGGSCARLATCDCGDGACCGYMDASLER